MKRMRRVRPATIAMLALLAPATMSALECPPSESSLAIRAPVEGAVFGGYSVFVRIELYRVDPATLSVLVSGVERKADFTITAVGDFVQAKATLFLPTPGPQTIEASAHGAGGTLSDTRHFTLDPPSYFTPDEVMAGVAPVDAPVTVRGEVRTATLTLADRGVRDDWRYFLLKVSNGDGLSLSQSLWGVGARLSAQQIHVERIPIPYPGDVVEVTGTLTKTLFGAEERFTIDPVTSVTPITAAHPPLSDIGGPCARDMDCGDDLFCNRDTLACELGTPINWSGDPRGLNGACDDDADCPAGEICRADYLIKSRDVDPVYGAYLYPEREVGRKLCQVPNRDAPVEEICPRTVTTDDLHSGRFVDGKEICLEGTVFLCVFNPLDFDTHCQMFIDYPVIYFEGRPPITLVGTSVENAPPYKDPVNPAGALGDLPPGAHLIALGTVRWDDYNEWHELHPYKWWRVVP
ncbi:MAG: hypothetical protein KC466_11045 [Myxococcales bacterium]|nr:hypothetical protein [Myxococcales bacterium]